MESYFDVFSRKVLRKINPMWYLYSCWRKSYQDKTLNDFIQNNFTAEDGDKRSIKKVMRRFWLWRGVHHSDFHEMSLDKKSEKERRLFVPRWEEVDLYFQVNDKKYIDILVNKWNGYNFFKDVYKRKVVYMSKKDVKDKNIHKNIMDFINTHDRFIIKPLRLSGGSGIRMYDGSKESANAENVLLEYLKLPEFSDGLLLEEMIIQDSRMAAFHPESVNTIRIMTINFGDSIITKWPVFRMGRGKSVVDNACSGGVYAAIDEKTGITIRGADNLRGSLYTHHPDTNMPLVGFQSPCWNELCETVKSLASRCPDCHIMGWDMALTVNGWVVIECNYGPCIVFQWGVNRGVRDEFEEIRDRLHVKKGNSYLTRLLEDYLSVPLNP